MPRNGSGVFSLAQPPFIPGSTISSTSVNSDLSDIATAMTGSIASDGQTAIVGQLKFPNGTVGAPSHTFIGDLSSGMFLAGTKRVAISAGGSAGIAIDTNSVGAGQGAILQYLNGAIVMPVGTICDFAGVVIPPGGWLLCFGQAIGRAAYPELFAVVSTQFGSGDGSTTFNLPDCRGRVTAGKDDMGGVAAGRITVAGSGVPGGNLGGTGGGQSIVLAQANLPAVTLLVAVTINDPGHTHSSTFIGGTALIGSGASFGSPNQASSTGSNTTGITASGVTDFLGSGVPAFSMNPVIIFNKIIFAGRP